LVQFVAGVVEIGDEQRDDLEPQSHRMNATDAIEDGGDTASEFVIVAIIETLQVDFVEIEPGAYVVENLLGAVAVGDESREKSGGFRFFENCDSPFAGDERLIIGADENFRALIKGVAHERLRRGLERQRNGVRIAQSLRRDPVLTVSAMQIAAEHAEAVGESARIGVEERLLLDGIALHAGRVSPGDVELAAAIEADFADSGLTVGDGTTVAAGEAADAVVAEIFDQARIGFADSLVENVAQGGHGGPLGLF